MIKKINILLLFLSAFLGVNATHLIVGNMTYTYLGTTSGVSTYSIRMELYRDCAKDGTPDEVPFDKEATMCIFLPNGQLHKSVIGKLISETTTPADFVHCELPKSLCLRKGVYSVEITLPSSVKGIWQVRWERCCKAPHTNLQLNLGAPYMGESFTCRIASPDPANNVPWLRKPPVPYVCINDTVQFEPDIIDPDGDSLTFRLVIPIQGASSSDPISTSCPTTVPNNPKVDYASGFSLEKPFGDGGFIELDSVTGACKYFSKKAGLFAIAVEVNEYKNGQLFLTHVFDKTVMVRDTLPSAVTGIEKMDKMMVRVYPNPAMNEIRVEGDKGKAMIWKLHNASGQCIDSGSHDGHFAINVMDLPEGLYFLEIFQASKREIHRVSVMH